MWQLVAAEAPAQDSNVTLILGIVGSVSLVLVAVVGGVFSLLTAKQNRTSASPPAPVPTTPVDLEAVMTRLARHGERLAVLEHRAEDADARDEVQDRRLDRHDELLDDDSNPRWRHLHDRD
ncbi:MAG: hypothetical protein HOV96_40970 [Nonomuraea sp.]|nr:hypothetical protein [Nonomuraea sp.]NUR27329.1 hypothetical protein [Catenulispora sp.]NUR71113.1 hypothetical protein [Hamadaea sp.]